MEVIFIDCRKLNTMEDFYDAMSEYLNFPDYFGRNLDALSDCLDDVTGQYLIYFYCFDGFINRAGNKASEIKPLFEKKKKTKQNIKTVFE